jgi:hypothetical protein
MAKRQDRKYNYPKGYIDKKTGKAKRGFMSPTQGARIFVKGNVDEIKKGNIPYSSLTAREKAVFNGLTNPSSQNTFYYKGKQFYDPTGAVRAELNQDPATEGKRNLTNLLSDQDFKEIFNKFISPGKKSDLFNLTQKEIVDGKALPYRTKGATNLDLASRLKRLIQRGYGVNVDGKTGKEALEALRTFEMRSIDDALKGKKNGNVQIFYKGAKFNPVTKQIEINTDDAETVNFDDTV